MIAKQTLLDWLAADDLQKVFKALFGLAEKYKNEQLRNDATFQSGRLKALERQRTNGIISSEDDHLEAAKIRQALVQIIQGMPDEWALKEMENVAVISTVSSKINWKKYAAYVTALVALLGGIAEFSGYNLRDLFLRKETVEQPSETLLPDAKVSTSGDKSPGVITNDGDVKINYEETENRIENKESNSKLKMREEAISSKSKEESTNKDQTINNSQGVVQIGGNNYGNINIDTKRRLSDESKHFIKENLAGTNCSVAIGVLGMGGEPSEFAEELLLLLSENCLTSGVFHGIGFKQFNGVLLMVSEQYRDIEFLGKLIQVFELSKVKFEFVKDNDQPQDRIYIYVGNNR